MPTRDIFAYSVFNLYGVVCAGGGVHCWAWEGYADGELPPNGLLCTCGMYEAVIVDHYGIKRNQPRLFLKVEGGCIWNPILTGEGNE